MNPDFAKRVRLLASVVSVLAVLAIAAVVWVYSRFRSSLPVLDGTKPVPGLASTVTVDRDGLGVPTIHASSRVDAARALGFLHAQDRFFQMDVWRRAAAGELSEIFGVKTLEHDRAMRMHGFRKLAKATIAALPADQRALVDAYTAGVNAGLRALREKPFEYIVVRADPQPWRPEDTILVSDAMLVDLQDDTGRYGQTLRSVRDQFGEAGLAFFAPLLTPADAALDGSHADVAPLPAASVIDLRHASSRAETANERFAFAAAAASLPAVPGMPLPRTTADDLRPGSNAFALAGAHTATGAAMVAGDMHLNLRVPNVWYRASLQYPGHTVTGVTLPGVPLVIAGSNGHVAWSFTNAYVDTGDLVVVETNPIAATLYQAPGHADFLHIEKRHDAIAVRGTKPQPVDYDWTIWGPIVGRDDANRQLAYEWTGHDPAATNLALLHMEDAKDVAEAVAVAHRSGMPPQNCVIADTHGDIAWTIAGFLPRRVGYDGRLPVSFQYGDRKWDGFVPPEQIPVVSTRAGLEGRELAETGGRIWSANQRMLGGDALGVLGDGNYGRPNRAAQIRDDLASLERATAPDLLHVQLDDRAVFLEPWHKLMLDTLTSDVVAANDSRRTLRSYVEKWQGRASTDSVSYPLVRSFRIAVLTRIFQPIFRDATAANPAFNWSQLPLEGATWKILRDQPANLLDPTYASWKALLVASIDDVITRVNARAIRVSYATWGELNRAEIRHPFSYTLPWFVQSTLDMPADPLPGDNDMPRVQGRSFGASERFVVSPGHEDQGIFEMPCGQSGHPLSPYYRAGHEAWVHGEATPFLPGTTEHTLTLTPASQ